MASKTFIDFDPVAGLVNAEWLNEVDAIVHDIFSGAQTVAEAKIALGLTLGTDVQAYDDTLQSISALGTAADRMLYTTGVDVWAETVLTAAARSILDDATVGDMRTTLGLVIGTDIQAYDATLLSIALLGTVADKLAYTTATDVWAETPLTSYMRTLLDDTTAAAARTTLDVYSTSEVDVIAGGNFPTDLVKLIHPDEAKGLQELQAIGVYPSSFNQGWGGMGYGGLPDGTLGEIATGCLNSDGSDYSLATGASTTYRATGFKVGKTTDLASVWVKIYKVGDPTNNLELYIYDDSAGAPNAVITNGTATAQDGHLHTDSDDGEWVKFVFPTAPNCTGGSQYHIVLKSSGAVDASNYWRWIRTLSSTYPHGSVSTGDATPTWTPTTTAASLFLIEPVTTILQDSTIAGFDGALNSFEGAPLDQSGGFYFKNSDLNHKRGTVLISGTGWNKGKVFYDSGLSTDNNRLVGLCTAGDGFAGWTLYENDETKHTITGTTDISTGNHCVAMRYRAEGDGSDVLYNYVDGASEGTPLTTQTFTLDRAFEDGHTTIGGGFPLAPTWTDNEDMSVLPSASGWTWTGTATEASAMVVSGGILYQNGAGYGSTQTGYYVKTTTRNNATGWADEIKIKIKNSSNAAATDGSSRYYIQDGTYGLDLRIFEYFMRIIIGGSSHYVQHDFTKDSTVLISTKGTDSYIYINGRLVFDGSGLNTTASANNETLFGDSDSTATENSTVEWHYIKYYEGAYLSEYSTMALSELANWNDDKSDLLDVIYNSGSIQSVKSLAGINENYVKRVKQSMQQVNITVSTESSTFFVPIDELTAFVFGTKIKGSHSGRHDNNGAAGTNVSVRVNIDGSVPLYIGAVSYRVANPNYYTGLSTQILKDVQSGLHFVASEISVSASSTDLLGTGYATLKVEAE